MFYYYTISFDNQVYIYTYILAQCTTTCKHIVNTLYIYAVVYLYNVQRMYTVHTLYIVLVLKPEIRNDTCALGPHSFTPS